MKSNVTHKDVKNVCVSIGRILFHVIKKVTSKIPQTEIYSHYTINENGITIITSSITGCCNTSYFQTWDTIADEIKDKEEFGDHEIILK